MSDEIEWRTVIEDARHRHAAVVALIYFTDTQAMGLLRLYVTLGIAAASGAVASLANNPAIPKTAGVALFCVSVTMLIASGACFVAMQSAKINLPGRGAEFWLWAIDEETKRENVLVAYLNNLQEKHELNNSVNKRTARALRLARLLGMLTPAIALVAGGVGWYFGV